MRDGPHFAGSDPQGCGLQRKDRPVQAAGFQGLCPSVKSTRLQVLRSEFSSWSTLGLVCMGYSSWKALRSHESYLFG